MAPFRVFIASPVYEFAEYRQELLKVALEIEPNGEFEFSFFEKDPYNPPQQNDPEKSVVESIFDHFGGQFDAFFLAFRHSVGNGTKEEFEYFRNQLRVQNPDCRLWWRQVDCQNHDQSARNLLTELHKPPYGNTGLQRRIPGPVDTPDRLALLFSAKLMNTASQIREGKIRPHLSL